MSSSDRVRTDGHDVTPVVPCTSGGQPEKTYPCEQGVGGWFFRERSRSPDRGPNRARSLPKFTNVAGGSQLSHAMHWPDAPPQNSERTARRAPSEQVKNRASGGRKGEANQPQARAITGPGAVARFHC